MVSLDHRRHRSRCVFVATDPVTHPARPGHQIAFAILIGCLLFLIRTQGNLPDGIAFAVLLANCTTPLFNRLHRQKIAEEPRPWVSD